MARTDQEPVRLDRSEQEMEAVARLDHPNLVRANDAGEIDGIHFLIMELVPRLDLAELAGRVGSLPDRGGLRNLPPRGRGACHAHAAGLIHRDIKPSNVIVTPGGVVKILDLGLARFLDTARQGGIPKEPATGLRTPDYAAPEQWINAALVDHYTKLNCEVTGSRNYDCLVLC